MVRAVAAVPDLEVGRRLQRAGWLDEYWWSEAQKAHGPSDADLVQASRMWRDLSYYELRYCFSHDEIVRLFADSVLSSSVERAWNDGTDILWKVQNSLWQYGVARDYERSLKLLAQLRGATAGLPDFELRLTWTTYFNTAGWSVHSRSRDPHIGLYLDGPFGFLLYYKGRHVMTIGCALATTGIFLAQVQMRHDRGNRFLFKLGAAPIDFALGFLQRIFPDELLWMVTGASTVDAIRRAYREGASAAPSGEILARVQAFYEGPLAKFARTATTYTSWTDRRVYVELQPV